MSSTLKNRFQNLINKICNLSQGYDDTTIKVQELILKKKNMININIIKDTDDIKFYNSIFDDSIFYIQKSISIRKKKFNYDFIQFYKFLDDSISENLSINLKNKNIFLDRFNLYLTQENNYKWLKNNKKLLNEWIISFEENIKYHIYLYENLVNILDINIKFFTDVSYDNSNKENNKELKKDKSQENNSINSDDIDDSFNT